MGKREGVEGGIRKKKPGKNFFPDRNLQLLLSSTLLKWNDGERGRGRRGEEGRIVHRY